MRKCESYENIPLFATARLAALGQRMALFKNDFFQNKVYTMDEYAERFSPEKYTFCRFCGFWVGVSIFLTRREGFYY